MCAALQVEWLGRVSFEDALARQEALLARKVAEPATPDTLLLLEHEPVYTIGRTPDQSSLRDPENLPHPLVKTSRGGQATYHGPGQLIGYPVLDLRERGRDLHCYLRDLEELVIAVLQEHGIAGIRREALTGVWVGSRKIASIGVGVRHWVTMHGFALNVGKDLSGFDHITPCGIAGVAMTAMEQELGHAVLLSQVAETVRQLAPAYLIAAGRGVG